MTLSTLTIQWSDLMNYVAVYLGTGRESDPSDPQVWDADTTSLVNEQVQAGYRQKLWPPPLPGERKSHEWSYMRTFRKLVTVVDRGSYTLPDDVSSVIGSITFETGEGTTPLVRVKLDKIMRNRQHDRGSGTPRMYTVVQMPDVDGHGQIRELLMWPEPDSEYNLRYQCYLNPNALSSTSPYPICGAMHSETLKQSCLAAAELHVEHEKGEHWDRFMERLSASVYLDRQTTSPDSLGYCGSNRPGRSRASERASSSYYVTLDGETG